MNEEECQNVGQILGTSDFVVESNSKFPLGCNVKKGENKIYFNKNIFDKPKGNAEVTQVCKVKKNVPGNDSIILQSQKVSFCII